MRNCSSSFIDYKHRALAFAVACSFVSSPVLANPSGATVVSGSAAISSSGNTLTVTNTPNAIINWHSFSIGPGETTQFIQQSAASAILNRITGGDPSLILGTLQSNGRVFLINPAGIVFGAGSVVDVAGLVASTLNITDDDFLSGRHVYNANIVNPGNVTNAGQITTPNGGFVYLIGTKVENSGVINTPSGEAILAAGHSVEIVDSTDLNQRVLVKAESQDINLSQLMLENDGNIFGVLNSGMVSANTMVQDATGKIYFKSAGTIETAASSLVEAKGSETLDGGHIQLFADNHAIYKGVMNASGSSGGFIETSGSTLHLDEVDINLSRLSSDGSGGKWLIDPTNITIDATLASTIAVQLNSGSFVEVSTAGGGSEDGNILVLSSIQLNTALDSTLTLSANNDIVFGGGIADGLVFSNDGSGKFSIKLFADIDGIGGGTVQFNGVSDGMRIDTNGGDLNIGRFSILQEPVIISNLYGVLLNRTILDAGTGSINIQGEGTTAGFYMDDSSRISGGLVTINADYSTRFFVVGDSSNTGIELYAINNLLITAGDFILTSGTQVQSQTGDIKFTKTAQNALGDFSVTVGSSIEALAAGKSIILDNRFVNTYMTVSDSFLQADTIDIRGVAARTLQLTGDDNIFAAELRADHIISQNNLNLIDANIINNGTADNLTISMAGVSLTLDNTQTYILDDGNDIDFFPTSIDITARSTSLLNGSNIYTNGDINLTTTGAFSLLGASEIVADGAISMTSGNINLSGGSRIYSDGAMSIGSNSIILDGNSNIFSNSILTMNARSVTSDITLTDGAYISGIGGLNIGQTMAYRDVSLTGTSFSNVPFIDTNAQLQLTASGTVALTFGRIEATTGDSRISAGNLTLGSSSLINTFSSGTLSFDVSGDAALTGFSRIESNGGITMEVGDALSLTASEITNDNAASGIVDISANSLSLIDGSEIFAERGMVVDITNAITLNDSGLYSEDPGLTVPTLASISAGSLEMGVGSYIQANALLQLDIAGQIDMTEADIEGGGFFQFVKTDIKAGSITMNESTITGEGELAVMVDGSLEMSVGSDLGGAFNQAPVTLDVGGNITLTDGSSIYGGGVSSSVTAGGNLSLTDSTIEPNYYNVSTADIATITANNITLTNSEIYTDGILKLFATGNISLASNSLVAGFDTYLDVGGTLLTLNNSVVGSYSPTTIFINFPNLSSGGISFLNGGNFFVGSLLNTLAVLNSNLFITYGLLPPSSSGSFVDGLLGGLVGQSTTDTFATNPYLDSYGDNQTGPGDSSLTIDISGSSGDDDGFGRVRECS